MTCKVILIETRNLGDWNFSSPKPLANIGRETVLARLQRQIGEMGLDPIVLTDDYDIMAASKKVHVGDELPEHFAILPGNVIHPTYMSVLNCIHDKPDDMSYSIDTIDDYWGFVQEALNSGELDSTE